MSDVPDALPPLAAAVPDWAAAVAWHRRLNRRLVVPVVPGTPEASAVLHLQGLFPDYAKVYVLLRTRKGGFVAVVAALPDLAPLTDAAALETRAAALGSFDAAGFAAFLCAAEPAFRSGHRTQARDLTARGRRGVVSHDHPTLGAVALYPLRFPTVLRDLGLDPSQADHGVRRDWMVTADLAARAGIDPTPFDWAAFLAEEKHRAAAAVAPARGLADAGSVRLLAQATRYRQDAYLFYAADGPHREARRQAAEAYPAFARALADLPALRRAIDRRRPLLPALARAFQVSEATIRCFQGFPHKVVPDHVDYLLLFLQDIDGSLCPARRHRAAVPVEQDQWACFALLAHELNSLAFFIGGRTGRKRALRDLLKGFDGDWAALFEAVGGISVADPLPAPRVPVTYEREPPMHPRRRALEEERIAAAIAWDNFRFRLRLPRGGEAVRDAVRAFGYAVVLPLAASGVRSGAIEVDTTALKMAEDVATAFVLGGRPLVQITEFSRRFHASIGSLFRAPSLKNLDAAALSWSRPSLPVETPSGLEVVPLGSVRDLVEEGTALQNCLPFYAVRCAIDGHRVLSVRCGDDRLAAFEIARGPDATWGLRQIEGPRNGPADPLAEQAAQWYVAWLGAQGAAAERPPADAADSDVLRALCGYDWRDPAAVQAVWELWAKQPPPIAGGTRPDAVLPRGAIKKGLGGLVRTCGFDRLRLHLAGM